MSEAPLPEPPAQDESERWVRDAIDACFRLDQRWRGRPLWALLAVAATTGAAVPLLALRAGEVSLGLAVAGWLPPLCLLLAGSVWVSRCRRKDGTWELAGVRDHLAAALRLSLLDVRSIAHAPKSSRLSILSRWALGAGLAGLLLSSALGVLELGVGQVEPMLCGASLWSASLLLGSQLLTWALSVQAQTTRIEQADLALAAREFAPIVDLSVPLELESVFLRPTPLHLVMEGLASWRDAGEWSTAEGCAAALQRHLWSTSMPHARLELGRRLGSESDAVADLVVDDAVLIDVQLGLDGRTALRVLEHARRCRESWGDGPIVVVICPAGPAPSADALDCLAPLQDEVGLIVALAS